MRYSKEHAEQTRQRLLKEGARQVKERGIAGASVHTIARAVGLSGPAIYSHFESKGGLLRALVGEELAATARRFLDARATFAQALAGYLSLGHVRAPAKGCALPAITNDVARADDGLRDAFQGGFEEIVDALAEKLDGQRELSLGVLATSVGAVALARALPDDARAQELLTAAKRLVEQALAARGLEVEPAPRAGGEDR